MTLTALTTLEMYRGEQMVWEFTITESGVAVDLTGATVKFAVYANYPSASLTADTTAVISKTTSSGIVLTDADAGIFELTISKADTNSIEMVKDTNEYVYGVEYIPAGETEPRVIGTGKFILYPDVVRA